MHDAVADYQNALQAALAQDAPNAVGSRYASAIGSLPVPFTRTYPVGADDSGATARFTALPRRRRQQGRRRRRPCRRRRARGARARRRRRRRHRERRVRRARCESVAERWDADPRPVRMPRRRGVVCERGAAGSRRGLAGRHPVGEREPSAAVTRRPRRSAALGAYRFQKRAAVQFTVPAAGCQVAQSVLLTRGAAAAPHVVLAVRQPAAHVAERPRGRPKRRTQHLKRVLVKKHEMDPLWKTADRCAAARVFLSVRQRGWRLQACARISYATSRCVDA